MPENDLANEIYFFKSVKLYTWFFLLFGIVLSLGMTGVLSGFHFLALAVIPPTLYLSEVLFFKTVSIPSGPFLRRIFCASLIIKIAAVFLGAFILYQYSGKPFLSYNDDYLYNQVAQRIVERWQVNGIGFYKDMPYSIGVYSGYPNFSALLMYIFGKSYFVPRLGNAVISSFSIYYIYKIVALNYKEKHARLVALLYAFSPMFILYSAFQLKDTLLIFCLSGLLYYICLIINKKVSLHSISFSVLYAFLLLFLRPATLLPVFVGLVIFGFMQLFFFQKNIKKTSILVAVPLIGLSIYLLWLFASNYGIITSAGNYFAARFGVRIGGGRVVNSQSVIHGTSFSQILSAPLYMVFSIFLPIPLAISLPGEKFVNYHYIPLITLYSLLPIAILALKRIIKKFKIYPTALFLTIFMILYKLGQAASFSIFDSRQSLPALLIFYLLLPVVLVDLKEQNTALLKASLFICTILIFAFAFVRYFIRYAI